MTTTKKKTPAAKPKATRDTTPNNLESAGLGTSAATTESGFTILNHTKAQQSTTDSATTVDRVTPHPSSLTTSKLADLANTVPADDKITNDNVDQANVDVTSPSVTTASANNDISANDISKCNSNITNNTVAQVNIAENITTTPPIANPMTDMLSTILSILNEFKSETNASLKVLTEN
jgi:hypothetical protein